MLNRNTIKYLVSIDIVFIFNHKLLNKFAVFYFLNLLIYIISNIKYVRIQFYIFL